MPIYILPMKKSQSELHSFQRGKIDFVGDEADLDMEKYADADIHDIGGKCLMPGFIDMCILAGSQESVARETAVDRGCR